MVYLKIKQLAIDSKEREELRGEDSNDQEQVLTCVDENELVVLGNDGSALGAVLLAELVRDPDGLGLGEQAGARVALLGARQPVAVVALQVRRRWDLGLVALDLLAAEDVRVLSSHVVKPAVLNKSKQNAQVSHA